MFKEKCQERKYDFQIFLYIDIIVYNIGYQIIEDVCLQKYDRHNEHFSMDVVTTNEEGQEEVIAYDCIYRYEKFKVKLKYNTSEEKWILVSNKYHSEELKQLEKFLTRVNKSSLVNMGHKLDERIQNILQLFDGYFNG
jgi:hypothetical protein